MKKTLDEVVTRDIPRRTQSDRQGSGPLLNQRVDRAGIEPAKPCTPNRQSSVVRKNDRRSCVSEGLRRSTTELRRNDLHQSRAGGIRTHDIRLLRHVLQLGSRSLSPSIFYYSGRRGSRTLKACLASSAGFQLFPIANRFALPLCFSMARPGIEPGTSR